jgi:hypothetical protein
MHPDDGDTELIPRLPRDSPREPDRPRRRIAPGVAVLAVVLLIALGVGSLPSVRGVLRQSFTRMPTPYTELYFTGDPVVDGFVLRVPVAINAHVTTKTSYSLRAWLVDGTGAAGPATTSRVTSSGGVTRTVVQAQITPGAEVVWIDLVGQGQQLHFRIAGDPIPSSSSG